VLYHNQIIKSNEKEVNTTMKCCYFYFLFSQLKAEYKPML